MTFDSRRRKLKSLCLEFYEVKFPKFSSSEELSNWIEDLILVDAYYVGLGLSVSEGAKFNKQDLYDLSNLEKALNVITPKNKEDISIIEECRNYLNKLREIELILREL